MGATGSYRTIASPEGDLHEDIAGFGLLIPEAPTFTSKN
jgi:hypothetical protein